MQAVHNNASHNLPQRALTHLRQMDEQPDSFPLRGRKILVVENLKADQVTLVTAIRNYGGTTNVVATAGGAMQWEKNNKIDGMVLDEALDDGLGTHLLERFIEQNVLVPVVSVSCVTKVTDGFKLRGLGVFACLEKPIQADKVARAIQLAISTGSHIHKSRGFEFLDIQRLREIVDCLWPHYATFPDDMRAEIKSGREALMRGKSLDREQLHGFRRFLSHPHTRETLHHMGIGVVVQLIERMVANIY